MDREVIGIMTVQVGGKSQQYFVMYDAKKVGKYILVSDPVQFEVATATTLHALISQTYKLLCGQDGVDVEKWWFNPTWFKKS